MLNDQQFHNLKHEQWYKDLVGPIRRAVYIQDPDAARKALNAALELINERDQDAELGEVLKYRMCWYRFVVETIDREDFARLAKYYQDALACVAQPGRTTYGEVERRRVLVILKSIEYEYDMPVTSRAEMEELLEGLPGLDRDELLWHALAGWAFVARDPVILGRAFEVHLTEPSNELGQAKWQRVNLMYQLVQGKATRRDVAETITKLMVLPQLNEFIELIWPVCIEQGLVDDGLQAELRERIRLIDTDVPPVPDPERKTKSIRNS